MKWLLAFFVVGGVVAIVAVLKWSQLRDRMHSLVASSAKPRTSTDATTPVPKDLERHEEFLQRIKQGDIELLFLGDSLTDLWPAVSPGSWRRLTKYKPANFGIGADRTEHLLWRIQHGELDGITPNLVVLLIGTNNLGAVIGERPEWAAEGIRQIIDNIRSRLPQTKILLLALFPRDSKNSSLRERVSQVNGAIRSFADGEHVLFADFGDSFRQPNGELRPELFSDGLHLTAEGYEVWYRRLDPLLEKLAQPAG
jgi:lysophospholipase L1-like esterase